MQFRPLIWGLQSVSFNTLLLCDIFFSDVRLEKVPFISWFLVFEIHFVPAKNQLKWKILGKLFCQNISHSLLEFNQKNYCHSPFLCQCFVPSDRERDLLQDEDHSGSRPHSFPGLYLMRSGWTPEWLRSHLVIVGS